jgi:hypothetical protein
MVVRRRLGNGRTYSRRKDGEEKEETKGGKEAHESGSRRREDK